MSGLERIGVGSYRETADAPLCTVRLEIQGMKQAVLHAFSQYQIEASKQVTMAVEAVCNNFDFAGVAAQEARNILHAAVTKAVSEAAHRALQDPSVQEALRHAVCEALVSSMAKAVQKELGGI